RCGLARPLANIVRPRKPSVPDCLQNRCITDFVAARLPGAPTLAWLTVEASCIILQTRVADTPVQSDLDGYPKPHYGLEARRPKLYENARVSSKGTRSRMTW